MWTSYTDEKRSLSMKRRDAPSATAPYTGAKRAYSEQDQQDYGRPAKGRRFDRQISDRVVPKRRQDDDNAFGRRNTWEPLPQTVEARMFIRAIPRHVTEDDVRRHFSAYGKVLEVVFKKNYGFVQFPDAAICLAAVNGEKGKYFFGTRLQLEVCHNAPSDPRPATGDTGRPFRHQGGFPNGERPNRPRSMHSSNEERPAYVASRSRQRLSDGYHARSGYFDDRGYTPKALSNEHGDNLPVYHPKGDLNENTESSFTSYGPNYTRPPVHTLTGARFNKQDGGYSQTERHSPKTAEKSLKIANTAGRRDIRPSLGDGTLGSPSSRGRDVPDVQVVVLGDCERGFIKFINDAFLLVAIKIETIWVDDNVGSRDAAIKQVISEGSKAVVVIERGDDLRGTVYLQVFEYTGDSKSGNVRFDEYDQVSVDDAVLIVQRTMHEEPKDQNLMLTQSYLPRSIPSSSNASSLYPYPASLIPPLPASSIVAAATSNTIKSGLPAPASSQFLMPPQPVAPASDYSALAAAIAAATASANARPAPQPQTGTIDVATLTQLLILLQRINQRPSSQIDSTPNPSIDIATLQQLLPNLIVGSHTRPGVPSDIPTTSSKPRDESLTQLLQQIPTLLQQSSSAAMPAPPSENTAISAVPVAVPASPKEEKALRQSNDAVENNAGQQSILDINHLIGTIKRMTGKQE